MQQPEPESYPLSAQQQTFWRELEKGTASHKAMVLRFAMRLRGPLDRHHLRRCLEGMIRRHAPLRTRFEHRDGRVIQVVEPEAGITIATTRCPGLPIEAADLVARLRRIVAPSMDLTQAPLLQAHLLERAADDHVLFFTTHHLVFDGVSAQIFYKELIRRYGCADPDDPSALAPLDGTHLDYVEWQSATAAGPVGSAYKDYLRNVLPDFVEDIPTVERGRPGGPRKWGGVVSPETARGLHRLAQSAGATVFNVLLAMYQAALHLCLDRDRMLGWVAVAGQHRHRFRRTIGCLMNEVPAFSACHDRDAPGAFFAGSLEHWREVGQRFRGCAVEPCFAALDNAASAARSIDRALAAAFLYQSFFRWLMPTDATDPRGNLLRWTWMENVHEPLDADISMTAYADREGGIRLRLQWAPEAIRADIAERMAILYPRLLHLAATDPGCRMDAFRDRGPTRRAMPIRLPAFDGRIGNGHLRTLTRRHPTGALAP